MALGKCPRRFQRQLFLATDCPIVGLCNVRVAFRRLAPELAEELSAEAGIFGYNRAFQLKLGEAVVQHGIDWCHKHEDESYLSRFKELRDQDDGPHFMPERKGDALRDLREEHEYVNSYTHPIPQYEGKKLVEPWSHKRSCAMCSEHARREGELNHCSDGDRKKRRADDDGKRVKQTWWACNRCKVCLCSEECFETWDHAKGCAPGLSRLVGGPCEEADE